MKTEMCYPSTHSLDYIKYHLSLRKYKALNAKYSNDGEWILVEVKPMSFLEKFMKQMRSK